MFANCDPYIDLTFMYTNLFSLSPKFDLFLVYVNSRKPTFIILTETWLNSKDRNSTYNIPGYTLFRLDRNHKKKKCEGKTRGGGIAMYVRDCLHGIPIVARRNHRYMCEDIEALYLDIQYNTYHFLLVGVYRPDDTNESIWRSRDTKLWTNLVEASENNNVIIAGDFNYPSVEWPILVDQP